MSSLVPRPGVLVVSTRPRFAAAVESALEGLTSVVAVPSASAEAQAQLHPELEVIALDDYGTVDPGDFISLVTLGRKAARRLSAFLVTDCWGLGGLGLEQVHALTRALRAQYCAFQRAPQAIARFVADRRFVDRRPEPPGSTWIKAALTTCRGRYKLTNREINVVEAVVRGRSNKQIANELVITLATVRTHVLNVFKKVGVASRSELAYMLFNDSFGEIEDGPDEEPRPRPAGDSPRVLLVCEASLLRARALETLSQASLETLAVDRTTAHSLIRHGINVDVLLLDLDVEPTIADLIQAALASRSAPRIVAVVKSAAGASRAQELGLPFVRAPFGNGDLLRSCAAIGAIEGPPVGPLG